MTADELGEHANIIPFGKYKGRLIEELLVDDPGYLQWLAGQDWFRAKFNILHQVIINRGAEPEETPEHNALQVKFLDDDFCLRFVRHYCPDIDRLARKGLQGYLDWRAEQIESKLELRRIEADRRQRYASTTESLTAEFQARSHAIQTDITRIGAELTQQRNAQLGDITFRFKQGFEAGGVDVVLEVWAISTAQKIEDQIFGHPHNPYKHKAIKIELKSVVGDDYPAVLRQMKANGSDVLFVGEYRGRGATQEQFVQTMATAGIRVVFAADVAV